MSAIPEIIRAEENNTLSFGDYTTAEKKKVSDFEFMGDVYKVKTHNAVTRLEKNDRLLLECVPGATIHHLSVTEHRVEFSAEGHDSTSLTLEMEPVKEYKIFIDGVNIGSMKSTLAGKISFAADLTATACDIRVEKKN